jgi:hypothetical protein
MKKPKTFFVTNHDGPGGPVSLYTGTSAEQQVNRMARTLTRRLFGRKACYTKPNLLSINQSDLRRHYGFVALGKHEERRVVFSIIAPTE